MLTCTWVQIALLISLYLEHYVEAIKSYNNFKINLRGVTFIIYMFY